MKENKIRRLLNNEEPTLGTRIWSTWPFITEAVGSSGIYDYVEFIAEYAPFTQYDLENLARAAELHGMGTMIKVDFQNRAYIAQKAMAAGFQSVLFTDHRTPDEVRESIEMVKVRTKDGGGKLGFPGGRWIGFQPHCVPTQHISRVDDVVLAFMIEKQETMDNIEEICAIPGVDMVQFGPFDYAMDNGKNPGDFKDEIEAAKRKMIEVALKNGVQPRIEIFGSVDEAQQYIDLGVRHFCFGDEFINGIMPWVRAGKEMRVVADKLK